MRPSLVSRKIVFCGSLACWARGAAGTRPASTKRSGCEQTLHGWKSPFGMMELYGRLNLAFRRSATRPGTKAETSPPIPAIWRTSVAVMGRTAGEAGEEDGLDLRRHGGVHGGHLDLVVEIRAVAQAAHDEGGAVAAGGLDGQIVEGHHLERDAPLLQQRPADGRAASRPAPRPGRSASSRNGPRWRPRSCPPRRRPGAGRPDGRW